MFLRPDNTLKWNWIIYGAIITAVLVFVGIIGGDKVFYSVVHHTNCNPWVLSGGFLCSLSIIIGQIFSVKVWVLMSILSVFAFFVYKAWQNEFDFRFAFYKIKNSYVFYVCCSVLLAVFTTGILKVLIGRSRPILFDALDKTYFEPWTFDTIFNSMPSGHAAASFAGLVMIGMLFPRIKWATWTMAILIGLSRVYVGAHWGSDVVFGAFIGMLCADIVKNVLKKINTK
jgi:membrane-associated phospholipid phosphatase